jgi:serine-type D-Ala-D-Ala carboxypeptidase (penicillin-binding protein 5/6)
MKNKVIVLFFTLSLLTPSQTLSMTNRDLLLQQIEILKQELIVIQSLVINMSLNREIKAKSYIAVNLDDNSILIEKKSEEQQTIASITKLMTAVIVLENIDSNHRIILTQEMLKSYGYSPAIFKGLEISSNNLLRAMLIQSTNDAAESLSYFIGKDYFISLMNQKAKNLEMNNTIFRDVHGLSPENKSTAKDLVKLLYYIYEEYPEILSITRDNNFWLPGIDGKQLKFRNMNNFYYLDYFIGGKTGYLTASRETMASVFEISKKPIAIVVLNSDNRQADIFSIINKIRD